MFSRTHVLISESFNNGVAVGGSTPLEQPANWVDWASMYDELTWTLSVLGTTGAPTSWSLSARFQYRQMHAGTTYRFQTPRWYDLSADNISADVREGVGWYGPNQIAPEGGGAGVIATQATDLASPIVLKRTTIAPAGGMRVKFDLTMAGGTDPRLKFGLEVTGRGR